MLFDFYLTHGSIGYLTQAKKISFVETGKNAEYSIWGARQFCPGGHCLASRGSTSEFLTPKMKLESLHVFCPT